MTSSPYTHPSMPRTAPMVFDLSAALEDAEGTALVEAIHRPDNPRLRVWNDRLEDWRDVGVTHANITIPEVELFREPGRLLPKKLGGKVEMTFQDLHEETMALLLGYPSVMEMREENEKRRRLAQMAERWSEYPIIRQVPPVESVRWSCRRPTAPVYAVGTNGWLMEQYEARLTPAMREHNRRIAAENAAIIDRFAKALGIRPHDSRD